MKNWPFCEGVDFNPFYAIIVGEKYPTHNRLQAIPTSIDTKSTYDMQCSLKVQNSELGPYLERTLNMIHNMSNDQDKSQEFIL